MIFTAFFLAAAVPVLDKAVEQDLRCAAAISMLVARADETGKTEAVRKFLPMGEYFFGKLDARAPDLDFMAEARKIVSSDTYSKEIVADFDRCQAEFLAHQERLRQMAAGSPAKK